MKGFEFSICLLHQILSVNIYCFKPKDQEQAKTFITGSNKGSMKRFFMMKILCI